MSAVSSHMVSEQVSCMAAVSEVFAALTLHTTFICKCAYGDCLSSIFVADECLDQKCLLFLSLLFLCSLECLTFLSFLGAV